MAQTTKEFFNGMFQCFLCLTVLILKNTNRCISSIIYENPTTFSLMQRFEITVINKFMICTAVVFIRFDITCMKTSSFTVLIILAVPQGTISITYTIVTSITFLTHEIFSISDIFVSFTFLGGHCLYNYCLSIYFTIIGS